MFLDQKLYIYIKARMYVACIHNIFSDLYIIAQVLIFKKKIWFINNDDDICTRALIKALINC